MNLFDAVKYGASLAFCIGPTFFYLIGVSLKQGFDKAVHFALGIAISDILILLIVLFGMGSFFQSEDFKHWFNLVSALFMIAIGIYYLNSAKHDKEMTNELSIKDYSKLGYFMKGVLINGFNPFTGMMWVFIGAQVHPPKDVTFQEIGLFTLTLATTVFLFDCAKAYLAKSLKALFTPQNLQKLDLALGIIFISISIFFLFEFSKFHF